MSPVNCVAIPPSSQGLAFCGSQKVTVSYLCSKQFVLWFYIGSLRPVCPLQVYCQWRV